MIPILRGRGFILSLIAAILLASLYPEGTADGSWLRPERTSEIGIFAIFLIQGCLLPTQDLLAGSRRHRLNGYILVWSFIAYPLIAWGLSQLLAPWISREVQMGLIFLAILPTTVSSAVVLTQSANGRVAPAIFNTVVSNLLGIVWVPFVALWLLSSGAIPWHEMGTVLAKLSYLIALPLAIGQVIHWTARRMVTPMRRYATWFSNAVICFIVYIAVGNSILAGVWESAGWRFSIEVVAAATLLMLLATAGIWLTRHWASSDPQEQSAAFFCASQKTLAAGVPMAMALFDALDPTVVGLILIPLIYYHPLQLIVASSLVARLRDRD